MLRPRRLLGIILSVTFLAVACWRESAVPTATEGGLSAAAGGKTTLFTITFDGDIQGSVSGVPLNASDPLKQVTASGVSISLPALAVGNTAVCDQKQPTLGPSTNEWRGYASAPWAGDLTLSRRRNGYHLQLTGSQQDASGGSINLAVNDVPAAGSTNSFASFVDARALISAFSYADTDGSGNPIHDPQDRCVNFTVTATQE